MGVHGLWDLLAPAGRRVSVETLAGKRLAIDASIWMVQFMKAMRDEKGEMFRNAHLLGFFRRICKLLFLRARPVFVFDGATPALKRRTVMTRRRNRDNAQAKVRKTAEKLLLNHLKAMRLKELADDIKNQRQKQTNDAKGEKAVVSNSVGIDSGKNEASSINDKQEKLDEMLAASIMAEEGGILANNSMTATILSDEDEEMILSDMLGEVDPAVLAALTPSLQRDLLQKQNNDAKGKSILSDKLGSNLEGDDMVSSSCNQEKLDEMLAASLREEEKMSFSNNASTSNAPYLIEEDNDTVEYEDEEEDEDEEMIVPAMDGGVDPSILASLPPSMQLDLLVQIRERLMAENRQKYQKVKKDPGKFSELQIQAYLKTVAFRREIDQVQKTAAGRVVDGVHTSRIASEANREFIFSSSFTGDKQELASGKAEKRGDKQHASEENSSSVLHTAASSSKPKTASGSEGHPSVVHAAAAASKSKTASGSKPNGDRRVFDDNIDTYIDERGRVRVSRVRAMGIHMTRDLQRNLDLMKEVEQERENLDSLENESNDAAPTTLSDKTVSGTSHGGVESIKHSDPNEDSMIEGDASIEISFEHDGKINRLEDDDDIFTRLVAENPTRLSSDNITPSEKLSSASDSDCEWEEGTVEANGKALTGDVNLSINPLFSEGNTCDDSDVDWEEGVCEITKHTVPSVAETRKMSSKGYLEEEADLQEAMRRSLRDSDYPVPQDGKLDLPGEKAFKKSRFMDPQNVTEELSFLGDDGSERNTSLCEIPNDVGVIGVSKINDSLAGLMNLPVVCNPDDSRLLVDAPCESHMGSPKQSMQEASIRDTVPKILPCEESVTASGISEVNVVDHLCVSNEVGRLSTSSSIRAIDNPQSSNAVCLDVPDGSSVGDKKTTGEPEPSSPLVKMANSAVPLSEELMNEFIRDIDNEENLAAKKSDENSFQEIGQSLEDSAVKDNEDFQTAVAQANLEEELRILDEERLDLGDERRRFERNAESVSSEMYTECQELLQIFGIPYIIAPMEAEAQCAFMELANLVDGVVTDDSDVFLFGARSVYKNIFDDRKYVETYFMKDVENELGLTREKLIRMALLLGSDYTEGVSGIGIVNAIEVLNAFPEDGGLQEFRDWIESPDPTILSNFGSETDNLSEAPEQSQSDDQIQERRKLFMDKHRKVSKNWHIPSSFPSGTVISAYLSPEVDRSTEAFTWGKPDHFVLRKLCWEKFGWSNQKADELILPVLKEYNKRETQRRLEEFYAFNERFAKIRSKRIKKAVKGITGKQSLESMYDGVPEVSESQNNKTSGHHESEDVQSEEYPQRTQTNYKNKSTPKQSRKRKKPGDAFEYESPVSLEGRQVTKSTRTQMSGSGRGRGRGRTSGRGKRKGSPIHEASETSSSNDEEGEAHMEMQGLLQTRRSTRTRKHVDYAANDSETDDLDHLVDTSGTQCFGEEASEQGISGCQERCVNAASGFGQEKLHSSENVSPDQGLDTDYFAQGGGFCLDNNDNDRQDSEEYFKTGGGFCTDEVETCADDNSLCGQATTVVADDSEPNINDSLSTEVNDQSKSRMLLQETHTNPSPSIPVGALRSMPHLRRKRRKN